MREKEQKKNFSWTRNDDEICLSSFCSTLLIMFEIQIFILNWFLFLLENFIQLEYLMKFGEFLWDFLNLIECLNGILEVRKRNLMTFYFILFWER